MAKREHVIEHSSQLNALSVFPPRTHGLGVIRLGGAMVDLQERETWEQQLNNSYYACGCDTGAKGLLLGTLIGIVAFFLAGTFAPWPALAYIAGGAILGAIVGKLAGLARAQGQLRKTIREITKAARPREPKLDEAITCG